MPIHCICPNGHRLALPERFAGSRTRCSRCGETIQVPRAEDGQLSDTGILQILGEFEPPKTTPQLAAPRTVDADRDCPRCGRAVPQMLRICPACRVYLPLVGKAAG